MTAKELFNKKTAIYEKSLIIKEDPDGSYYRKTFNGNSGYYKTFSYIISYFNSKWNIIGCIEYYYHDDGDSGRIIDEGSWLNDPTITLSKKYTLLLSRELSYKRV